MFDLIKDDYFLNGLWYDNIRITITEMLLKVLKPSWLLQLTKIVTNKNHFGTPLYHKNCCDLAEILMDKHNIIMTWIIKQTLFTIFSKNPCDEVTGNN